MGIIEIIRALIGFILVLFLPGYAWSLVIFDKKEIDLIERIALSFGISIAIVPTTIFFLNKYGKVKISETNILLILILLIVIPALIKIRGAKKP